MSCITRVIFVLMLSLFTLNGMAQAPAAYETHDTVLQEDFVYDVQADGTYTLDRFKSMRINNQQGVQASGQVPVSYSTSLEELAILEAYTTTKDGKRIDVPADKILEQQSQESRGAPMFDDAKVKVIVFPNVEIGSVLSFRVRSKQKIPMFPNAFSMTKAFGQNWDYKASSVTVRAPESMKMYVEAIDLTGGEIKTDKPGTKMWRWALEKPTLIAPEPSSVSDADFSPRLSVSSFPNYEAVASAYLARAKPKAAVTRAIQKLADKITEGITDKRAQTEALYRWVSKDIRYVGVFLGFGGFVPHSADEIANVRYGDCKDHVTILDALLAAKGIRSSTAVINAGNSLWMFKEAFTPYQFNHVITYLPDFDLYVDSTTSGLAPFGVLPPSEYGKTVLLTDDGTGKAKLVTLPTANAAQNQAHVVTKVTLSKDGTLKGKSKTENTGVYDAIARSIFSNVNKGAESQFAGQVLTMTGQQGTGSYSFADIRDLTKPFGFTGQFELPNYVQMSGPSAMRIPVGLGNINGITRILRDAALPKRNFPMTAGGGYEEEVTTLTMPEGTKIISLPKPVTKENALGRYQSTYTEKGNTITVKRAMTYTLGKAVIGPDEYPLYQELGKAVYQDFNAQILFQ
ncbi:MAG: DUF3857 domain-containing protein [Methylotenera sp.]|nr:DUF3857 domain-containing protein [Methylotenera sp.]